MCLCLEAYNCSHKIDFTEILQVAFLILFVICEFRIKFCPKRIKTSHRTTHSGNTLVAWPVERTQNIPTESEQTSDPKRNRLQIFKKKLGPSHFYFEKIPKTIALHAYIDSVRRFSNNLN